MAGVEFAGQVARRHDDHSTPRMRQAVLRGRSVPGAVQPAAPAHADDQQIVVAVGNAARHTDSAITITVSALGERVEIRVIDRGPGIPQADWDLVFRPFQRLGDHDNTAGTGLGLALARGLTEAMGGTLTPEETPGGGITMVLSLPATVTAPQSVRDEELLA